MAKDAKVAPNRSSIHLDLGLVDRLIVLQRLCLLAVALISVVTLAGWASLPLAHLLPAGWVPMKDNVALAALCGVFSLVLSQPKRRHSLLVASRICAAIVGLIALSAILERILHLHFAIDNLLVSHSWQPRPGRMSPQTATLFALLCPALLLIRARKGAASRVADLLVLAMSVLVLIMGAGHLFGASRLSGVTPGVRVSLQSLFCLMLLTYVTLLRRAEHGVFAILLGVGIGSKIARIICPFALFVPFLLDLGENILVARRWMSPPYAAAISSSAAAILGFGLILLLAWRIDTLERAVRDLSLRDELTTLYNRRGFYALAEQLLHHAHRSRTPFSVLFIDLDELKQINDSFGHETGSVLLAEFADLLKRSFRKSDVIGRVGGDEFVVAGQSTETSILFAIERLKQALAVLNAQQGRMYQISFSYGNVTSDVEREEPLDDLLGRADRAMYKAKQHKKEMRGSGPAASSPAKAYRSGS
jgi:diguanylate cyclase (GGDEF)-like protein